MLFRMRIYQAVPANLPAFHDFFREFMLPVYQRHGARLIGRWETEDDRVVAIWEFDDREACERVQAAVESDPDFIAAIKHKETLPELYTEMKDVLMTSTVSDLWV
jgi:hypothetical protein